MAAKADQLSSTRFTALAHSGERTPITKSGGVWRRGTPLPALRDVPKEPVTDLPETQLNAKQPPAAGATKVGPAHLVTSDVETMAAARLAELEAALRERYVIKHAPATLGPLTVGHTEYRFRGDTSRVAFTETTFRLATDTNSPSVARSMVDVAQARNWNGLRVSGSEDFRRLVWLEASARSVKTIGYEPNPADLEALQRERAARQTNRIEMAGAATNAGGSTSPAAKNSDRGNGGRRAVLAAIEAILVAKNVPQSRREAVLAAATEQLSQRIRVGQVPRIKIYDPSAPSNRPVPQPEQQVSPVRDRTVPQQNR
jgi:hypothetical protein